MYVTNPRSLQGGDVVTYISQVSVSEHSLSTLYQCTTHAYKERAII